MVLQSDLEKLQAAWRALDCDSGGDGWRTIPIDQGVSSCRLLAGRHFPGNEEAVLVGFSSVLVPPDIQLPQGQGFGVETVKHEINGSTHVWVSLSRHAAGNMDMFARMAEDVLGMLRSYGHADDQTLLHMLLFRIKAWQEFMQRGWVEVLGPEAEVGLVGELSVLKLLIEWKLSASTAIEGWQGPLCVNRH